MQTLTQLSPTRFYATPIRSQHRVWGEDDIQSHRRAEAWLATQPAPATVSMQHFDRRGGVLLIVHVCRYCAPYDPPRYGAPVVTYAETPYIDMSQAPKLPLREVTR